MASASALTLTPNETLTFEWGPGVNVQKNPPKTILTADLPEGESQQPVIYKVKTTAPKRYVVKPPQGVVMPGQRARIMLTMVVKDAVDLLNKSNRGLPMEDEMKDKFLVQSAAITDAYYKEHLADKDDKTVANTLSTLWPDLTARDKAAPRDKKVISSSRLTTNFNFAERPTIDPNADRADATQAPPGSPEAIFAELSALRKKYDQLVTYTVVLTGEREYLNNELTTVKNKLERELAAARDADKDANTKDGADATKGAKVESHGFSIFVVLLAALAAFLGGRFSG